jgi:type I restriction enzyme S subunit
MKKLTAAEQRLLDNATLTAALHLTFKNLQESDCAIHCLDDIAETTSGGTPNRNVSTYYGGEIPWIKSGELNDDLIETSEEYITDDGLKNSSAKIYPKGTLVVALYGATVGKTGILAIDAASNQAVCAVFPRTDDVRNNFLYWFFRHKRPEYLSNSFGGAQPNISQKIIRETLIPLPNLELQDRICGFLDVVNQRQNGQKTLDLPELPSPFNEQRRIIARIEELVGKVEEARGLRSGAIGEVSALTKSANRKLIGESPNQTWIPLGTYIQGIENGKSPACEARPAQINEWGVVKVGCVSFGTFDQSENKALPPTLKPEPQHEIHLGDFLMSRANTTQLVGACAIVESTRPQLLLSDKIFRFIFRKSNPLEHRYLNYVLKSPALRSQIEQQATGTSLTMKNISKEKVLGLLIPRHSLVEQRRIVAYLDDLQTKVDSLKRLQSETEAELNALLPSILDKAFKDEL